jgi:MazG family protein
VQTPQSLRNSVLEEAYEVVEAIDSEDYAALSEELGDLLLIVAMQAQLAEEAGDFTIEDVYDGITRKLIRRHPHVFGDVTAQTPDAVVSTWEDVKAAERAQKGAAAPPSNRIDRLPRAMPATRKVIEMLAPRATLSTDPQPGAGDAALQAVTDLIDQGIDPEIAIERALRAMIANRLAEEEGHQ